MSRLLSYDYGAMLAHPSIIHVATPAAWAEAQSSGAYVPDGFAAEGFIHCCAHEQLEGVLAEHFAEHTELLLLIVNVAKLDAEVRVEAAANGQSFPHIYGPIEIASVAAVVPITAMDGVWALPD
jgi:uncharacterized protein (DUF952 family)